MAAVPFAAALPLASSWDDAQRSCHTVLNFLQALAALAPLALQARVLLARRPNAQEAAQPEGPNAALPARCAAVARHWYLHSSGTERGVFCWFMLSLTWMISQAA